VCEKANPDPQSSLNDATVDEVCFAGMEKKDEAVA
jgi:hypothetical protein